VAEKLQTTNERHGSQRSDNGCWPHPQRPTPRAFWLATALLTDSLLGNDSRRFDQNGRARHILHLGARRGWNLTDFRDHVEAFGHMAEHRITIAVEARIIEFRVIRGIDEKLRGGGIGIAGTRHRDGAGDVFQATPAFQRNGCTSRPLIQFGIEAAALNHEARDDPMKNGAGILAARHVLQEVRNSLRRRLRVEF
jgi:hypothetical protein